MEENEKNDNQNLKTIISEENKVENNKEIKEDKNEENIENNKEEKIEDIKEEIKNEDKKEEKKEDIKKEIKEENNEDRKKDKIEGNNEYKKEEKQVDKNEDKYEEKTLENSGDKKVEIKELKKEEINEENKDEENSLANSNSEIDLNVYEYLNKGFEILSTDTTEIDYNYKLIIMGDSGVGKTCLTLRLTLGEFREKIDSTIGFEYCSFVVKYQNKILKLDIWDTCGKEAYRSLIKSFFYNTSLVIIVYSVDNRRSFTSVDEWIKKYRTLCSPNAKFFLVGNKNDVNKEK